MDHHSRFDQLVAATEELIHENERVRTKFTAFEAALQDVVDNQKALWRAKYVIPILKTNCGETCLPKHNQN